MRQIRLSHRLLSNFAPLLLLAAGAGCGKAGEPAPVQAVMDPPIHCNADLVQGTSYKLVTRQLLLPKVVGGSSFVEDYDGDGRPENQFKNLINLAIVGGFDVDAVLAEANQAGQGLLLMELTTADLLQADCASLSIRPAQPPGRGAAPPKFDGTDTFAAADAQAITLYGRIDDHLFQSIRPRDQQPGQDVRLEVSLPLSPGDSILLSLHGAAISAQLAVDEKNQLTGVSSGSIHGVLTASASADVLQPAVARAVTAAINRWPSGNARTDLIGWFENMHDPTTLSKCMVTADCCARSPSSCKILPAEVGDSAIAGVLAPDVEVFDASWNWKLVPAGHAPNGYSVGLGLEAVRASF
jgi:hypothetical protein